MSRFVVGCVVMLLAGSVLAQDAGTKANQDKKKKPARKPNPAMAKVTDVEGLPRVLLIGDSISIGYTVPVRKLMEGVANVHRPLTNCGPTTRGVEQIEQWLGDGKWDVIHFNWGLHDLKYMGPNGKNLADPKAEGSHQQVPPKEYAANLRKLVARLKKTGAKLIWRNTTPVPEGSQGRIVGDSKKYNDIAAAIMQENEIPIDDHYSLVMKKPGLQRKANVHFSPEGSQALAKKTVAEIKAALKK